LNLEPVDQTTNGDKMMTKQLKLILMTLALFGILLIPAFSQEDMEVVDNEGFSKKQRPPAVFRHDEHNEKSEIEDCSECHHIYENGEKLEDESSEDQRKTSHRKTRVALIAIVNKAPVKNSVCEKHSIQTAKDVTSQKNKGLLCAANAMSGAKRYSLLVNRLKWIKLDHNQYSVI
jgi:hypothetical protein